MIHTPRLSTGLQLFARCLLAAVLFASVSATHAAVIVSNLLNTHAVPGYEITDEINGVGHDLANSFTIGGSVMSLDSITIGFAGGFGSGFTASLYSDAAGAPGTELLTLSGEIDPHGGGLFDYTAASPYTLAASTTYWAVFTAVHAAPNKQFPIYTTADLSQTGEPGTSIGNNFASRTVNSGVPGSWSLSGSDTPLQFSVNTSAVPEPSRAALLAGSFGVLFFRRRRRQPAH